MYFEVRQDGEFHVFSCEATGITGGWLRFVIGETIVFLAGPGFTGSFTQLSEEEYNQTLLLTEEE